MDSDLKIEKGCHVCATVKGGEQKEGVVRFVGTTYFAPGQWVGIELAAPEGKNNGTVQDRQYFSCPPLHGIFVKIDSCKALSRAPPPETPRDRRAIEEGRPQDVRDASPATPVNQDSPRDAPLSSLRGSFSRLSSPSVDALSATPQKEADQPPPVPKLKELDDLDTSSEGSHDETTGDASAAAPAVEPEPKAKSSEEAEKAAKPAAPAPKPAAKPASSSPKSGSNSPASSGSRSASPAVKAAVKAVGRPPAARPGARVPAKRVPARPAAVASGDGDSKGSSPETSPKVPMPSLTLNKVVEGEAAAVAAAAPPAPGSGGGGLLSASTSSVALATPRTPRTQISEDVRLLTDQKKSLELKLKEKHSELTEVSEKFAAEREAIRTELRQKYEGAKKADAETIKRVDAELKELQERIALNELEVEIAKEEKLLAEESLEKMKQAALDNRLMENLDPDCNDSLLEHCTKFAEALEQINVVVDTLTTEKLLLREEANELRQFKERAAALQKKCAAFEERLDEYADLEEDLEASCEEVARLKEERLRLQQELVDLKELSELSSALEHAAGQELEKIRAENDTLHAENADFESKLGVAKREAVENAVQIDKFRNLVQEYKESLREYDAELQTVKLKEQIGEEKQRMAVAQKDVKKEFDALIRVWTEREQTSRHSVAQAYKDRVLDFLPTNLVELETPLLDAMASLERALFYADLIQSASGELLQLQDLGTPSGDEQGYVQVSPGLFKDAAFESYDNGCTADLTALHMWLASFVLKRLEVVGCSSTATLLEESVSKDLQALDEHFRSFMSHLEMDAVSHSFLSGHLPRLFSHIAGVWARGKAAAATLDEEKRKIPSGTLLFFLLALLAVARLFQRHVGCIERYCRMYEAELSEENLEQVNLLLGALRDRRASLVQNIQSMYDDLEQVEVKVLLPEESFQKLQVVLMSFIHASMELRRVAVLLHDRAIDTRHGTTSKVDGFFSQQVLGLFSDVMQAEKHYSLTPFMAAPKPEDPRLAPHDLRHHMTLPLLAPDPDDLESFCVLDNKAPLCSLLQDASSVTFKVWSDLQKLYWDESGPKKDPNAVEGAGPAQEASAHLGRAMEIRNSLASVGDLLQKIKENETAMQSEVKRKARLENELAESLVEIDKLRTIADNVKEHGRERENLRKEYEEKIESMASESKKQVHIYRDAINELKADLETERSVTQRLSTAMTKRKTVQDGVGDGGDEALRLRQALLFSQKQLKRERHAAWKGRWRAACAKSSIPAGDAEGCPSTSTPQSPTPTGSAPLPLLRIAQEAADIGISLNPTAYPLPQAAVGHKGSPSFTEAKRALQEQAKLGQRVEALLAGIAHHRRAQQQKEQQRRCAADTDRVFAAV